MNIYWWRNFFSLEMLQVSFFFLGTLVADEARYNIHQLTKSQKVQTHKTPISGIGSFSFWFKASIWNGAECTEWEISWGYLDNIFTAEQSGTTLANLKSQSICWFLNPEDLMLMLVQWTALYGVCCQLGTVLCHRYQYYLEHHFQFQDRIFLLDIYCYHLANMCVEFIHCPRA